MTDEHIYGGPNVRTNVVRLPNGESLSGSSRSDLDGILNSSYNGDRNLYETLGYKSSAELTFAHHWARYKRFGSATALVDRFVESTWQSLPDVEDDGRTGSETAFEQAVSQLLSGEALTDPTLPGSGLRFSTHEALTLGDTFATLGEYSLLFLGFANGEDDSLADPIEQGAFEDGDPSSSLSYITPIREDQVGDIDTVREPADPRHGLPESYDITFDSARGDETVHHTRIIHVPEGTRQSMLKGERQLLRGWNRFDDLEKLLGGSAEMAWRGVYPGMVVTPPTDSDGRPIQFQESSEEVEEEVENWRHDMDRVFKTTGNVETLDPVVADVSSHVQMQYDALAATYDIPQSVLTGNERGDMATAEDRQQWAATIAGRRTRYAEATILRPLINRLRYVGAIPDPEGDDFTFVWESLDELSDVEWAELLNTKAQALKNATGGQPQQYATVEEIRDEFLDMPPERGGAVETAEADAMADAVDSDEEPEAPPESAADEDDPALEIDESSDAAQRQQEAIANQSWVTDGGRDERE